MILSDREIRAAIERDALRITPTPAFDSPNWSSTAIDLTLDGEISRWSPPSDDLGFEGGSFNPASRKFSFAKIAEKYCQTIKLEGDGFVLEPARVVEDSRNGYCLAPAPFILGWTIEKIRLPFTSRLAARVEGKSSLARLGVGVHVTAPTIHAGFGDKLGSPEFPGTPIQLEIFNVGPLPIRLVKGLRICQLIFEEVHGTPDKGYSGMFAEQGPRPA